MDAYQGEAGLTVLGSKDEPVLPARCAGSPSCPGRVEAVSRHVDVAIKRPIFVTGLVRTGTTAHRLLGADQPTKGYMWLAEYPQPYPRARPGSQTRCIAKLDAQFTSIIPRIRDTPACTSWRPTSWRECWRLLRRCIRCRTRRWRMLPSKCRLVVTPGLDAVHIAGTAATDWAQRCRKAVGTKESSHPGALDALMATYPDALVVQTHRPVETIMASMCSLAQHTTEGGRRSLWAPRSRCGRDGHPGRVGWAVQCRTGRDLTQFTRRGLPDLIADPLGTVADIYRHFRLTLSDEGSTGNDNRPRRGRASARS